MRGKKEVGRDVPVTVRQHRCSQRKEKVRKYQEIIFTLRPNPERARDKRRKRKLLGATTFIGRGGGFGGWETGVLKT